VTEASTIYGKREGIILSAEIVRDSRTASDVSSPKMRVRASTVMITDSSIYGIIFFEFIFLSLSSGN